MSLANSKASSIYKDALAATANGWDDSGIGFTEKSPSPGLVSISRQLNTLLFSVTRLSAEIDSIKDEVSNIHARVKAIEGGSGESSTATSVKTELDRITSKLNTLKITPTKEVGGNIKVFKSF